jgi:hypothetical protein
MSHACLHGAHIVTGVRQGVTAGMSQHVSVDGKGHFSALAKPHTEGVKTFRRHGAAALRSE